VDPSARALNDKEGKLADFLASHPPMRQRIARLHGMAFQQAKQTAAQAEITG